MKRFRSMKTLKMFEKHEHEVKEEDLENLLTDKEFKIIVGFFGIGLVSIHKKPCQKWRLLRGKEAHF